MRSQYSLERWQPLIRIEPQSAGDDVLIRYDLAYGVVRKLSRQRSGALDLCLGVRQTQPTGGVIRLNRSGRPVTCKIDVASRDDSCRGGDDHGRPPRPRTESQRYGFATFHGYP